MKLRFIFLLLLCSVLVACATEVPVYKSDYKLDWIQLNKDLIKDGKSRVWL